MLERNRSNVFEVEALARRELRGEVDDEIDVDPYTFVADLFPTGTTTGC